MRAVAILVVYFAPAVSRAELDQEFAPNEAFGGKNVGAANESDWAQTFTVGLTGALSGFDIWIERNASVQLPLLFDLRLTSSGAPTFDDTGSNILVAGQKPAVEIPLYLQSTSLPAQLVHIDLTTAVEVTAGDVLAIVLRSDDPSTDADGLTYRWFGLPSHASFPSYPGGDSFVRSGGTWLKLPNVGDSVFRTYVTPVPEPSTCFLSALGCGMFGITRVRRLRRPQG